ncbi:fatty acid desaturase [Thalassomonas actiniarum]|uniref:Fatty acid desaturase n=1 Tax=Thalassomonas actiniarum TaxID=485447 RepID=A0AAE9YZ47_9GAMM|nr:fatty acid desaturase [Thalassomonas actiniarum]WDE02198.1 fatty acid desaturase [Thalassomonas actiniarum]
MQQTSSNSQAANTIQQAIATADRNYRSRWPILKYQDAIGLIMLTIALAGMIISGLGYILWGLPAWLAIICSAFFAGLSHEIEHDLIHRLYFRKNAVIYHVMMSLVWLMRPNTVNPWYRRDMHLNHHKTSGTENDLEERILGNGMKFGFFRLLISLDTFISISLRAKELSRLKQFSYFKFVLKGAPLAHIYLLALYSFLIFHGYHIIVTTIGLPVSYPQWLLTWVAWLDIVAVVWLLPNALRAICLHGISAALHYYGDVDHLNKQCQVLNHWALFPVQLFCFNFGSTHIIHHFYVRQPFYIRQLIAKEIHPVMREQGIRFNDFHSLVRANLFAIKEQ